MMGLNHASILQPHTSILPTHIHTQHKIGDRHIGLNEHEMSRHMVNLLETAMILDLEADVCLPNPT